MLRVLVACPRCGGQFDVTGHAPGARVHCVCGTLLRVPEELARSQQEAPVVRCARCGGPRRGGESACGFCGTDFTVTERDRDTVCPSCAGRIGRASRFCPYCGVRIDPQVLPLESSALDCPVCEEGQRLQVRVLSGAGHVVLECVRCGGLWVAAPVLRLLEQEAQRTVSPVAPGEVRVARPSALEQRGPFYRKCPICGEVMQRRNYGAISGVIVDVCKAHGVWFDEGELEAVLQWVRSGGLRRAAERERMRLEEAARDARRAAREAARAGGQAVYGPGPYAGSGGWRTDLLADLADLLGELFGGRR